MADEFTKAALYWIRTFNRKVKEKIWMMKLIDLLNEYETPRSWVVYKSYDDYDWFFYWVDCDWETEIAWSDSLICSKKFWWIWWLVENDKIDVEKVYNNSDYPMVKRDEFLYEWLLMLLSIQDEPIRFLCEIIK